MSRIFEPEEETPKPKKTWTKPIVIPKDPPTPTIPLKP